jgi:hypothetical protein
LSHIISNIIWHEKLEIKKITHARPNLAIHSSQDGVGMSIPSAERIKMLHLIIRNGAKWRPGDDVTKAARRFLLKLLPDYTVEVIWVLSGHRAARCQGIEHLIKTPSMQVLIADHLPRINGLIQELRSASPQEETPVRSQWKGRSCRPTNAVRLSRHLYGSESR